MKQAITIIPARWASSRFPGKPLARIGGKAMIERVYEQARKAMDRVAVATDDSRIYDYVRSFGGVAVMTRADHRCGTERCCEAYQILKNDPSGVWYNLLHDERDEDIVVVNVQGDEPFIQPEQIEALLGEFGSQESGVRIQDVHGTEIATLVRPFTKEDGWERLTNPNTPKVVFSSLTREALLFSRSVIPYMRGVLEDEWLRQGQYYAHIGMYAYRGDVLQRIVQLPASPMEQAESLEQLRWLENGYRIRVAVTKTGSIGIDTPEDLERAERFLGDKSRK